MRKTLQILTATTLFAVVVGCASVGQKVQDLASKGVGVVVSAGTNTVGLLDVINPFVPDPTVNTNDLPPGTPVPEIPNPAVVGAVQQIGSAFGPWGMLGAGILGTGLVAWAYQRNQKKR